MAIMAPPYCDSLPFEPHDLELLEASRRPDLTNLTDARTEQRSTDERGTVLHAELDLQGSTIFVSTPEGYVASRRHRKSCDTERRMHENPWVIDGLFVEVDDLDAHFAQAVEAGATILREPEEPGVGYRICTAEDLEGHRWMFGQPI